MRIPDLDLDLLRAFVTVAERGGFTAAGLVLGLTQSAISLKVKRLEELLGKPVFTRGGKQVTPRDTRQATPRETRQATPRETRQAAPRGTRQVTLTREGETLLAYARRMLALNEEAVRRFVAPPMAGKLRLGVADHFVPRHLAPALARFARTWPELRIEVEVGRSHELRAALAREELDLVLGKRRDGETEGRVIFTEAVVWVAAPDFEIRRERPLPLAMLPQGCMFRDRALTALARAGIASEVVYTSPSLMGIAAAAQAGFALSVMGRTGLPEGLVELDGLPALGTAEMCLFSAPNPAGTHYLADFLIQSLWDGLGP